MKRAFTLFEVLLALALIAMLSGGVFAFLWQLMAEKAAVSASALEGQAADALIDRLESSLTGAVASDSSGASGIVGTATSLRVLYRGVTLPLKEDDRGWARGDLQACDFTVDGGTLKAHRWDAHRNRGGGATGEAESIAGTIGALKFRYYDGQAWADSFDSKDAGGLPVAIEVSMWFGPPRSIPADTSMRDREAKQPADAAGPSAPAQPEVAKPKESKPVSAGSDGASNSGAAVPAPDRIRIIVVPDGPTTALKELR